ncbi:MAG: ATP-binding cassette domain-containing protein [Pyrinomonadaceae bacterium]
MIERFASEQVERAEVKMPILEIENLTRSFGDNVAVDHVNMRVQAGQIFGLIGSNGAGKTTAVRMLTTLLNPTSGTARINRFDLLTQPADVRRSIGYVPQESQADEALTGREHLILQGRLYGMDKSSLTKRIGEVLELVGLSAAADKRALEYSGGMRKLLDVATGLIHKPTVLFVDEPTSGVDVAHRQHLIDYIRDLPAAGTTVFLTSHFLEEVDQLADSVALLDHGKTRVSGSPAELKAQVGASILNITLRDADSAFMQKLAGRLKETSDLSKVVIDGNRLKAFYARSGDFLPEVRNVIERVNASVVSLSIAQPTLDDVFFYHLDREIV